MIQFRDSWILLKRLSGFMYRVVASFFRNRGILMAGGLGYNALLSLIPFLTLTMATLSFFFDEDFIVGILRPELLVLVPQHADTILQTVQTFLRNKAAINIVSVVVLLFFSSIAFRMLEEAVAAIFHTSGQRAKRSFWVSALLPYMFIGLATFGLLIVTFITYTLDALNGRITSTFGIDLFLANHLHLFLRLISLVALVLLFAGIYRVLPVIKISMRRAFIGGVYAAILWYLVGILMAYYFANISMVNLIYGSLATGIVVLLFFEAAFIILLLGAQVIAELEASDAAGLPWYENPQSK